VQSQDAVPAQFGSFPDEQYPIQVSYQGELRNVGNAEIRVRGADAMFRASTLVLHHVIVHNYSPPAEFVQAVVSDPRAIERNLPQ